MPSLEFVADEVARREAMWSNLNKSGRVTASIVKDLDIYRGQAGIFADVKRTLSEISPRGIAISFRQTGSSYADDLSDDGVIYHYPMTQRAGSHDAGEIESGRTACRLGIPVFVVIGEKSASEREVRLGYIEEYDDLARIFLITFMKSVLPAEVEGTADPFSLIGMVAPKTLAAIRARPNQKRFAADVLRRYGPCCAVCDLDVGRLIAAAHIRPKKNRGSDDARNGLPLCANHHLAFDAGLWRVDPSGNRVTPGPTQSLTDLRISRNNLDHLPRLPNPEAIAWLWGHGFNAI